jgi:small basic protein
MTWLSGRLFSAILAATLGAALYREVSGQTGKVAAGLVATLLFLSSTHVFAWFTIVKTYCLSTLLLFLAYRAITRCSMDLSDKKWLMVAGVCLGASVDARLYFAGLLPVFLRWIYSSTKTGARLPALLYFLGGCALAIVPNLYLFGRDPSAYFFDNLGFHALRTEHGLIGAVPDKIITVAQLFLIAGEGNGLQMTLLFSFILILSIRSGIATGNARVALILGLVLGLICLLPTPSYVQYFSVTVPFLILFVVCSLSKLLGTLRGRTQKRYLFVICGSALLMFMVSAISDYRRFLITGDQVTGVGGPAGAASWRISSIVAVSRAIDEQARPAERVMSLWPGYIFQSKVEPWPGLENNSATYFADDRLSPAEQAQYHVLSPRGIKADITAHRPQLVVVGNQESMRVNSEPFEKTLAGNGYKVAREIGNSRLWQLR